MEVFNINTNCEYPNGVYPNLYLAIGPSTESGRINTLGNGEPNNIALALQGNLNMNGWSILNSGGGGGGGGTGLTGPTGYTGYTGPTGQPGTAADTGATGYTGYTGYTGPTGEPGTAADTGATGYTGYTGYTGHTGPPGTDADTGATGSTGHTGPTGPPGTDADTGATGATGVTGPTGPQGNTGPVGLTGPTGVGTSIDITYCSYEGNNFVYTSIIPGSSLYISYEGGVAINNPGSLLTIHSPVQFVANANIANLLIQISLDFSIASTVGNCVFSMIPVIGGGSNNYSPKISIVSSTINPIYNITGTFNLSNITSGQQINNYFNFTTSAVNFQPLNIATSLIAYS